MFSRTKWKYNWLNGIIASHTLSADYYYYYSWRSSLPYSVVFTAYFLHIQSPIPIRYTQSNDLVSSARIKWKPKTFFGNNMYNQKNWNSNESLNETHINKMWRRDSAAEVNRRQINDDKNIDISQLIFMFDRTNKMKSLKRSKKKKQKNGPWICFADSSRSFFNNLFSGGRWNYVRNALDTIRLIGCHSTNSIQIHTNMWRNTCRIL